MSETPARAKPPIDVKARVQKYQKSSSVEENHSPLVKSNSYNDLLSLRTVIDARDSWLQISITDKHPSHSSRPSTPPKPPARKKKFMEPPKQSHYGKNSPETSPTGPRKLGSTELSLLPPPQPVAKPRPTFQKSQSLRATPPRPPPPSAKPRKHPDGKSTSPSHINNSQSSVVAPLRPVGTSTDSKPVTPTDFKPVPADPRPANAADSQPLDSTLVTDDSQPPTFTNAESKVKPLRISPSAIPSTSKERRNSETSSSLSDSNEEEKKTPQTPSSSISRASSFFGKFKTTQPPSTPVNPTYENSFELEETFDVIPEVSNTNIVHMAEKLKEQDAKLHDANIYEVVQAVAREIPHIASSKDLPPTIADFSVGKREHVVHELYTTEYSYVKNLEVIEEVYKPQLHTLLGETSNSIFANVEDILAFNRGLLALLHTRLVSWSDTQCIGDIFLGMFNQTHRSMYALYCSNYDNAEQVFLKLKKRKDFELQLQACQSDSRIMPGVTLPMFLITPVQRIPRYILLLKDIIKTTSNTHPDFIQLEQAVQKMGELADYINLQIHEAQTRKTLEHLKTKVQGLADLENPNRSLVKEGQVFLQNIKKTYQCILFNDTLVFAMGDSRQSTVELQIPLEALWVEDLEDRDPQTHSEDAVELYTPQRPYTMYVKSNSEKKLWLPKLRETIYHHLVKNDKCVRNDNLESTTRHATFLYASQQTYNGHFTDSLRNGKGTMSWPNHSTYIGDWIDNERSGEGTFNYNTGEEYTGRWRVDKQNGIGELKYYSGDVYKGSWKDGLRHGKGKIIYSNGDLFEGVFHSGHIEGKGTLTCKNTGVRFNGDFKNSLRHGSGSLITIQGNQYAGEFNFNLIHGQGRMVYHNGDVYDGGWKNGMRQGIGKFTAKMEGHYEGSWDRDLKHGKGLMKYRNGNKYDGFWEYNLYHGKGTLTHSTGEVYSGGFEHGLMCGEGTMEYTKTMMYKGEWRSNLRHGHGTMTYEDQSVYEGEWKMGLRHGEGTWKRKDGISYSGRWEYDQPHGEGVLENEQTKYKYTGYWVNGKREGRGLETTEHWTYSGGFRNDMKHGSGEERTILGTVFMGNWERGRKHGTGQRRIAYGLMEEQIWKSGQLTNDPLRMTAVELPSIPRNDL